MIYLKTFALSLLLIVIVPSHSDLRAQNPTSEIDRTKRSTDEEIIRQATDLVHLAESGGSEGLGAATGRLQRLLDDNRDSVTAPILHALLDGMYEKRATQQLQIAMFYLHTRAKVRPAESRLREIVNRYPHYSRRDEVLFQLSLIEYESGRRAEAIGTLERLAAGQAFSPRAKDARASLKTYRAGK